MKFGGTSVEDAAAIRRLCQLVARPSAQPRVVVVSALAKVTDQLMTAGEAAAAGHLDSAREILQVLHQRHETVAGALVKDDERIRLFDEFADEFTALDKLLRRIASEKAMIPCTQDSVLGAGESLSSRLVHSALRSAGVNVAWSIPGSASSPTLLTPGPRLCGTKPMSGCRRSCCRCWNWDKFR